MPFLMYIIFGGFFAKRCPLMYIIFVFFCQKMLFNVRWMNFIWLKTYVSFERYLHFRISKLFLQPEKFVNAIMIPKRKMLVFALASEEKISHPWGWVFFFLFGFLMCIPKVLNRPFSTSVVSAVFHKASS